MGVVAIAAGAVLVSNRVDAPLQFDFVVVGAGIAGLRAAITLAQAGKVLVVTKESASESNTQYAQGGIAVAMGGEQDVALHLEDTLAAGDGLVYAPAAAVLVREGPQRVQELLEWGTEFDRMHGELMRTREGAHSKPRILHAHGDATGREIGRALLRHATADANIQLLEWTITIDILVQDGRAVGITLLGQDGRRFSVAAKAILLASGGAGQVYSDTTNPSVATGDGIAMGARAGAEIADMEFYQFHPTALSLPNVPRFLLSEALRGEGAWLRNHCGERFMSRYHPLGELAPRDVVARAIAREGMGDQPGETLPVYLDMRHIQGLDLTQRFPGISAFLRQHGLNLASDLIPVRPAAHYLMGGVRTDLDGRTSLPGLYAAGEVACTGVHGANRLASNSLLEGLVFGARAGEAMRTDCTHSTSPRSIRPAILDANNTGRSISQRDCEMLRTEIRSAMWRDAGLLRDATGLMRVLHGLQAMEMRLPSASTRESIELRNLHAVAELIARSALARQESRGAHARTDYPAQQAGQPLHSIWQAGQVRFAALDSVVYTAPHV
jgi:L-aspartate oxidase